MNSFGSQGGLIALLAAAIWGTGDFVGGLATRKRNQYHVLALASLSGLVCLLVAALTKGGPWPDMASVLWSAVAGVCGGIGIAALYRGLAIADAAIVAPTAAVVGVVLPVIVGSITHGGLSPEKSGGIVAGIVGIWLVSGGSLQGARAGYSGLRLAVPAGVGFGGFFVLIVRVQPGLVFWPLVVAKAIALMFAMAIIGIRRLGMPSLPGNRLALTAGVLDAAGNVLYLLAARLTRLELAAVISSMAPGATVLLATFVSRQRISTTQKIGVGLCLIAIALILV